MNTVAGVAPSPRALRTTQLLVADDATAAGITAAWVVSSTLAPAIARRGAAVFGISGGSTPLPLWRALADPTSLPMPIDWSRVTVVALDERLVPEGHPERNATRWTSDFLDRVGVPQDQRLLIGACDRPDDAALTARLAHEHAVAVARAGRLDLAHLGLGTDGHTASLFPGDPSAAVDDRVTTVTGVHGGHRRITVTRPVLAGAGAVLWFVTGAPKAAVLPRVLAGDEAIPAGRLDGGIVVCDRAALLGDTVPGGDR